MLEQEQTDLEQLKTTIAKLKLDSIEYMLFVRKMSKDMLALSGYKSIEQALYLTITKLDDDIRILTREYLKKYPDK